MEHFSSLCSVLLEFLGESLMPNSAELMGIYGRVCVNSFNILDTEMNSIGTAIYLAPSIMDHSCKPNAVAVFEGITIVVRVLEDIPRLDWSQVYIYLLSFFFVFVYILSHSKFSLQKEKIHCLIYVINCYL